MVGVTTRHGAMSGGCGVHREEQEAYCGVEQGEER